MVKKEITCSKTNIFASVRRNHLYNIILSRRSRSHHNNIIHYIILYIKTCFIFYITYRVIVILHHIKKKEKRIESIL